MRHSGAPGQFSTGVEARKNRVSVKPDAAGPSSLSERVAELRAWAKNRIRHCRDIEARFNTRAPAMYEAVAERRALQAVLGILYPEPEPKEGPTP